MRVNTGGTGTASVECRGTESTGHVAFLSTFSVTEPSISRSNPERPCVPMTTRSLASVSAALRI